MPDVANLALGYTVIDEVGVEVGIRGWRSPE
jgi:hypothetical protein